MRLLTLLSCCAITACGVSELEQKTINFKAAFYEDFYAQQNFVSALYGKLEKAQESLESGYIEKKTNACAKYYSSGSGRCME